MSIFTPPPSEANIQPATEAADRDDPGRGSPPAGELSRRSFLQGTGAAALALAGPAAALAQGHSHGPAPAGASATNIIKSRTAALALTVNPNIYFQEFREPPVVCSHNGELDYALKVLPASVAIREPDKVRIEVTRSYNGIVPGPTLRVRPGDHMSILLHNQLPPNTDTNCPPLNMNQPHCFNTTNLHTHGLHVSPVGNSDNVFLEIDPGQQQQFCFELPADHPPGTFWYHGHKHGAVALQLVNGLAGALIVEGTPEEEIVPREQQRIWILQEVIGDRAASALYLHDAEPSLPGDPYTCGGSECALEKFTVNALYQPTLQMRAGEVQRWRFVNATATPRGYTKLRLEAPGGALLPLPLVAVDGIMLPSIRTASEWLVIPGGRADLMIQLNTPGMYKLWRIPTQGNCTNQILAYIDVADTAVPGMVLPAQLPPLPHDLRPITEEEWQQAGAVERTITFDIDFSNPGCPGRFQVNGEPYGNNGMIETTLGAVEKWTIRNTSGAAHPFHIHVNPFQVMAISGQTIPVEQRYWQDTVDVPGNKTVSFFTRFSTFPGKFVLHCHILVHEDWGMMLDVMVRDTGSGLGPCIPVP